MLGHGGPRRQGDAGDRRKKLIAVLLWQLRWGSQESRVYIDLLKASNRPLPDGYLASPSLESGLTFYLEAFWELSSDRQIHMAGEGPIPFGSIDRFATRAGIEGADFWRFKSLIRSMDGEYLNHRAVVRERMRKQAVSDNENRDVGKERVAAERTKMAKKQVGQG